MNSRLIAARVLCRVVEHGQSATIVLDLALQDIASAKDRAFVQALCYGVLRQFHRLNFILQLLLHKPLKDTEIRVLALLGLYQLKYMRVKPHAAVSETVAALRNKPRAKPLLNALLRNYLREQDALEQQADNNGSASCSHPKWLIKQIEACWPQQAAQIFQENNSQAPMTLRVNSRSCSREDYLKLLAAKNIAAHASTLCDSAIILQQPVSVELLPGFVAGQISVQDVAAQFAAQLLDVQPGQRVLDVCAAPGGKAAHILEKCPELAELQALDIDATRLRRLEGAMRRLQLSCQPLLGDASNSSTWWDARPFERILLDAPCSALGVIRRHPDIKLLRRLGDIENLCALQSKILNTVWEMLIPGGQLLYATCSILKQENELQIQSFLATHLDAVEEVIIAEWGMSRPYGRQIFPGESGMDGFYYAKLRKQ